MKKINEKQGIDPWTTAVLFAGRGALGWYAWKANPKLTLASAAIGAVAAKTLDVEDNLKVGAHISLGTLTMRKHHTSITGLLAFVSIISHCDHHALDGIPFGPALGGYVVGCCGSSLLLDNFPLWRTKS